ncbi:unnamed protein product, partial [Urochloa humidicola]
SPSSRPPGPGRREQRRRRRLARSSRFQPFPSRKPPRSWGEQDGRGGSEMAKSCKGLAMGLVKCLSETDCVKVQKMPYKDCAGEKVPNITSECVGLRETYFNCKRGQVDMRARIRGNKGY